MIKQCCQEKISLSSNTIEVLIAKASIDSYISHDEFVFVNNVLTEYSHMEEEIEKY